MERSYQSQRWNPLAGLATVLGHLCLLALVLWNVPTRELPDTSDGERLIAVAYRSPDRSRYQPVEESLPVKDIASESSPNTLPTDASQPTVAATVPSAPPASVQIPLDLAAVLESMTARGTSPQPGQSASSAVAGQLQLPDGLSLEGAASGVLIPGNAQAGAGPTKTIATVFGVSGSGNSFVYVFDRSQSMGTRGGAPLRAAKRELLRSLNGLTSKQQFQIIFYNDQHARLRRSGAIGGLLFADEANRRAAERYVASVQPLGSTEHVSALKTAIGLTPDVIFFLTDARIQVLGQRQITELTRRAQNAGVTICCIQFGVGHETGEGGFLKELASRNHGAYRYVNVTQLP
ncbi:MAG: hypothetical protein AAGD07_06055 [Planctomycetota bacterium]